MTAGTLTVTGKSRNTAGLALSDTRTVVFPAPTAVISPLWLTVAAPALLLAHTSCPGLAGAPLTVTVICRVCPRSKAMLLPRARDSSVPAPGVLATVSAGGWRTAVPG